MLTALCSLSPGTTFSILPAKKKESLSISSREKFPNKVSFLLKFISNWSNFLFDPWISEKLELVCPFNKSTLNFIFFRVSMRKQS